MEQQTFAIGDTVYIWLFGAPKKCKIYETAAFIPNGYAIETRNPHGYTVYFEFAIDRMFKDRQGVKKL